MKTTMKVLTGIVVMFMISNVLRAADEQKIYKAPEHTTDKMGVKLVRGITNIATCAGEFPRQIYRSVKKDGWMLALPYGLGRGLTMTFVRCGYGVLETAFFYIPFNDNDYHSALNPPYVWKKEIPLTTESD